MFAETSCVFDQGRALQYLAVNSYWVLYAKQKSQSFATRERYGSSNHPEQKDFTKYRGYLVETQDDNINGWRTEEKTL